MHNTNMAKTKESNQATETKPEPKIPKPGEMVFFRRKTRVVPFLCVEVDEKNKIISGVTFDLHAGGIIDRVASSRAGVDDQEWWHDKEVLDAAIEYQYKRA